VRNFLGPYAQRHRDLAEVRATIEQNIPPTLSSERRAALRAELTTRETVEGVMETFLYAVGRGTFMRSFPLPLS
jgi:hypothetical protein